MISMTYAMELEMTKREARMKGKQEGRKEGMEPKTRSDRQSAEDEFSHGLHRKSEGQYDLLCERGGTGSSNICLKENDMWRRAEKLAAFIMGYRQGNGDSLWVISGKLRTYIPETHRYIEI